ncbi:MAG: bifunctional UDP-sugar hydrolase/5'-nucleotidase, partial [Bacilli bacterium]
MKKNVLKLLLLVFLAVLLTACTNTGSSSDETGPFVVEFSTEGNGYIECSRKNGDKVQRNTLVTFKAVALGDDVFIGWINSDGSEYSKVSYLNIAMYQDVNLTAKFSGESIEEANYDSIADMVQDSTYSVSGTVIYQDLVNQKMFIKDSTGGVIVETSQEFSIGDIVNVNGTLENSNNLLYLLPSETIKKVGVSNSESSTSKYGTYEIERDFAKANFFNYIYIECNINVDSREININGCDNTISIYNDIELDEYDGALVSVYGYFIYSYDTSMVLYVTDIEILQEAGDNIVATLPDWNNVQIVVDGVSHSMTDSEEGWTYKVAAGASTISFTSSEGFSTIEFNFEADKVYFTLGEVKASGQYAGFFTSEKNEDTESTIKKLDILEMNDLHGYITQDTYGTGGLSNASYLINQIRNETPEDDVLLVANGDMFQGTAISNLSQGETVVNAMNAMGFDFMGIGNHEFDWGLPVIFDYFDDDSSNGEATFPLINSNIAYASNGELVLFDGYNMYSSYTIEKNGVNIGIVSCIGDVFTSINYFYAQDYEFQNVTDTVTVLAQNLKDNGSDIVLVNIHGGSASSVDNYYYNNALANLYYQGNPLVDAIINGHTHQVQDGIITRDGADLPIVQGGANCGYVGEIELYYDTVAKEVVSTAAWINNVNSVGTNYDPVVEEIIDNAYAEDEAILTEAYSVAGETVSSKSNLYDWTANVMRASVGADIAISNTGGLRSDGDIYVGDDITLVTMYEINPLDNFIMVVEVPGSAIKAFLDGGNAIYYTMDDSLPNTDAINSSTIYKVAVIDYVYYWNTFP